MRCSVLAVAAVLAVSLAARSGPAPEDLLRFIQFRSIGPAVTGGRIVDVEAHTARPMLIYVASASGGLWKSENNGTTWTPVFDNQATVSIGDVAIAASNPDVVWVGTGEHNNQRSCHWGDGVYKSSDGGKTWQNMGLKDSIHIGRIAIDFKNPDVVYVASAGPLYRPGGDRGVYKTTDGGKTWTLVLKGDNDTTGFIDIAMDPKNNKVLYAAAYDRLRRAWHIRDSGPGSAIYKTTDAGKTWKKLENGLPSGTNVGRIGLAISPSKPKIVYATIDNRAQGVGPEVYRSDDAGGKWAKMNTTRVPGGYYYSQIRVDPHNPDRIYVLGVQLVRSEDGGKTYSNLARNVHVDHHGLWIDPVNKGRLLLGNDGGFYVSYDDGATWDFVNNLPIPQFYAIGADMAMPYNVMGGLQDNGVWLGPSRTRRPSGILNQDWISIYGGDGMYTVPDPEDPYTVYTSSQFGAVSRVDVKKRQQRSIRPRGQGLRFNWLTPFMTSPHNSRVLYLGANKVFKSLDRGDTWQEISPDLTTNDPEKIAPKGNVPHCTITTLSESPLKPGVIWAGTDDGNVWVTQNDGVTWTQVNQNIPDVPSKWWVSRVIASHHALGTAYVTFTGFREDNFRPFVYKTTDFGKTWTLIVGNLPNEPIAVIREDQRNPNLLVIGTELGCHISIDGGHTWHKLTNGLPTTPVQDLLIHPRDGDLILGTHGRGIFIANITPLRQLRPDTLTQDVFLFKPDAGLAFNFINDMFDAFTGNRRYAAPNPENSAVIYYYLKDEAAEDVKVQILSPTGVIRELTGPKTKGINSVVWDLRQQGSGQRPGQMVPAGTYGVRITTGGKTLTTTVSVVDWER